MMIDMCIYIYYIYMYSNSKKDRTANYQGKPNGKAIFVWQFTTHFLHRPRPQRSMWPSCLGTRRRRRQPGDGHWVFGVASIVGQWQFHPLSIFSIPFPPKTPIMLDLPRFLRDLPDVPLAFRRTHDFSSVQVEDFVDGVNNVVTNARFFRSSLQ